MLIWNTETLEQREIADNTGYPPGWTTIKPPEIQPGYRVVFGVEDWVITHIPVHFSLSSENYEYIYSNIDLELNQDAGT